MIMLLMIPIASGSSFLMNVSLEQQPLVNQYFFTRIWAAPATLGLYALMGWYFGMQNAKIPLLITIAINLINIALSYYFVKVLGYGIRGVAAGTVIAQYAGFFLALGLVFWKFRTYIKAIPLRDLLVKEKLSRFLNVNRDIFLRTVMLTFAFAFLYSQASLAGELFLAANVILLQFLNWMSYAIDGFAYAAESLVGNYYGAGDEKKTYKAISYLFKWGLAFAILFTIVFWLFGEEIVLVFSNQADVIAMTNSMLFWVIILPVTSFACYIWDGIYIGLTASKTMRNAMFLAVLVYIGTYYGLDYFFGMQNIWLALIIFLAFRGIIQTIYFARLGLKLP
jgi:MATE family multidrug resistance protein